MGANKTKINKTILNQLITRTNRSSAEIKAMYTIFRRHFPTGKIESPQDLWRCLQKFSLVPVGYGDPTVIDRLYRLFNVHDGYEKHDDSIDFFQFMIVSDILERGTTNRKIELYFQSLDVNNDRIITREDLEKCLPHTVESHQLIQQLLRQWDMNNDGVVSLDDFERFIMTNPDLSPMFVDVKDRVRMDSITVIPPTDNHPSTYYLNNIRGNLYTSQ